MNEAKTPEAPMDRPLIETPGGVVLNLDKVAFIARVEIGQFVAHFSGVPGVGAKLDSKDIDALRQYGIIQKLVVVDEPAAANDSAKIEIAS